MYWYFFYIHWDDGYLRELSEIISLCFLLQLQDELYVRRVEKYEVNLTSRDQDPMYAYLALSVPLKDWHKPNLRDNKPTYSTFISGVYYRGFIVL